MTDADRLKLLDAIRKSNKIMLTPVEVGPIIGCRPHNINLQVANDPSKLGFPVIKVGCNVKIPREAFLKWLDGQ